MRWNNYIVVACEYHNDKNSMHTPISKGGWREKPMAIGILIDEEIILTQYLPHVENCIRRGHWCRGCGYAKFYMMEIENEKPKGGKERNGRTKEMRRYEWKLKREGVCTQEELEKTLLELGFYVLFSQ
jgi:hypothetical protein